MSEHTLGVLQGIAGTAGVILALYALASMRNSYRQIAVVLVGIAVFLFALSAGPLYRAHLAPPGIYERGKNAVHETWDRSLKFLRLREAGKK